MFNIIVYLMNSKSIFKHIDFLNSNIVLSYHSSIVRPGAHITGNKYSVVLCPRVLTTGTIIIQRADDREEYITCAHTVLIPSDETSTTLVSRD